MSAALSERLKEIFDAASELSGAARARVLEAACGGDDRLRREVEQLLAAHDSAGDFLADPGAAAVGEDDPETDPHIGQTIERYAVIEKIGEGGFGTVYLAEQRSPVRRTVALKIIKPGMDSKQVIARFQAERQALAMMDHPNIARVLDAGATDAGRPYFVMELVRGVPITEYCDSNQVCLRPRLELFAQVCHAVQHAHQKGVIHRDLKPSNILVTVVDGQPVPKVIDFGVAKATGLRLTDKTLFTTFAQMVGTPLYMSPEQAEMTGLDVDTRSDVYSLGVLLYELLTGTTPVDQQRLREAAFDEMRRMIREEEPERPSSRLSESRSLGAIAASRQLDARKLLTAVRGDLDWIVMRSLEKDRDRRYGTAAGLASDVERYLRDEPVEARPPSAGYRLGKFARRNKAALAAASLVLVFLATLAAGLAWTLHDRSTRRVRASTQLRLIVDDAVRLQQAQRWTEALVSARRAEPVLAAGEAPANVLERARQTLTDLQLVARLEDIRAQSGTPWHDTDARQKSAPPADRDYAASFRDAGIDVDALSTPQAAARIMARGAIAPALLPALDDWVAVRSMGKDEAATDRLVELLKAADPDPWRQQVRSALARRDGPALENLAKAPDMERQPAATLSFLAAGLRDNAHYLSEIEILRQAQRRYPADYWINLRLGVDLIWLVTPNNISEGIGYLRAAVALRPDSAHAILNLGNGYHFRGELDLAEDCFRKAIELKPGYATACGNLAMVLAEEGRYQQAIAAYEQANRSDPRYAYASSSFALLLATCPDPRLRNPQRALELAHKATEIAPQESLSWHALGIGHYQLGGWNDARTAFEQALRCESNAADRFFLAMSNWQLGERERARKCYNEAVQLLGDAPGGELVRLRDAARELLEIAPDGSPPKAPAKLK